MTSPFTSIAVVGAGAVGGFFGAMLARAGHRVTLIGRPAHVLAIEANGLQLRMNGKLESIAIAATTEVGAVGDADLVLCCVKSTDTDTAARAIAPHLKDAALVLSLQNGVDNAETIARHVRQTVVPAVVYVATSMPAAGVVSHHGRGDLVIGPLNASDAADEAVAQRLNEVVELFASAAVPVQISPDVIGELWNKLLVNCAYNAISAIAQLPYGKMVALPEVRRTMTEVVSEVVAVAQADGQKLTLEAASAAVDRIAAAMPEQLSSTAQDLARGKPSEIDHLNGFVVRRGAERGVPTPVNQALFALVKLIESARVRN